MLSTFYPVIQTVVIYAMLVFVVALILRLIFNYSDPNPFGAVGRFSYNLKKATDRFVYPAARLLATFRVDTRLAPLVTIFLSIVLAYFTLQIIGNTFFIVDGLTDAILRNNAKALIGFVLYALVSVYFVYFHPFPRLVVRIYAQYFSRFCAARNRPGFDSGAASRSANRNVRYFRDARSSSARIFADDNLAHLRLLVIQFTEKDGAFIFVVRVILKSSKSEIVGEMNGALKVKINALPIDGAANAELIKILAKHFGVTKSAIKILKGQASKIKQIKIVGAWAANLPDVKTA